MEEEFEDTHGGWQPLKCDAPKEQTNVPSWVFKSPWRICKNQACLSRKHACSISHGMCQVRHDMRFFQPKAYGM